PDARQREFAAALKAARKSGRDFAREGRDGRITVLDLLAAPQLDRAAIDAALDRTRAADTAMRAQVERSVVDFAATL
ncbi:periplasmic heavy metal sensor, partial [Burkholderia cenocepacia]|nr:periplasmic heavy metal sensor [Burkholderia cenocepacia]